MKRRWLLTAWILSLLSFGGAWAASSAPCAPAEACCCCSDTAAQICCGCGCDVAQAPLPVSQLGIVPRDFVPFVADVPLRKPSLSVAVQAAPSPPRSPRQLDSLAGHADWRGPPSLV